MPEDKKFKRGYYKSEDDKDDTLLEKIHNENPDSMGFCGDYKKEPEEIVLDIKYIKKAEETLGKDASPEGIRQLALFYQCKDQLDELVKKLGLDKEKKED
jgi:hypothetical protein